MASAPFPQADDFNKIIRIVEINSEERLLDLDFMSAYLGGITDRQVLYYISAARYLGLLEKSKQFTELGIKIRNLDYYSRIVECIRLLMADPVFGKIYISQKILGVTYDHDDIAEVIKENYPNYSDLIYQRRAQTVISWIKWLEEKLNQQC